MSQRLNYFEQSPELTEKLFEFGQAVKKSSLGKTLIDLVNIRASQLNGCAFCLDMHCKEAKIHGELFPKIREGVKGGIESRQLNPLQIGFFPA